MCEVLSPSTGAFDRGAKLEVYAREGVPWVWFADPAAKTVEVLALDGETYRIMNVHSGPTPARITPFEAIELDLTAVFPPDEPETP